MPTPIIIAGFEFYPEPFAVVPFRIGGGPPRRSLNGKGFQRIVAELQRFTLTWSRVGEDEMQLIRIIWARSRTLTLPITCTDPLIDSDFFITDQEFRFEPLEGDGRFYRGSLTFEEEG
ncbi:hypothetical protein D3C87_1156430 [compost metagenome]